MFWLERGHAAATGPSGRSLPRMTYSSSHQGCRAAFRRSGDIVTRGVLLTQARTVRGYAPGVWDDPMLRPSPGRDATVRGCVRCGLSATRTQVVVGRGSPAARVAFVVDVPGYRAERSGAVLDGPAGELLSRLLADCGIGPEEALVTYLVKCRTPDSRPPAEAEVAACEPHLFAELVAAEPDLVCPMGTVATRFLTGSGESIARLRGRIVDIRLGGREVACLPLVHPAAAAAIDAAREALVADLALIRRVLDGERPAPPASATAAGPRAPVGPVDSPDDQLALFGG